MDEGPAMTLNRMKRHALAFSFACLLFTPSLASADTEFYVDAGRISSGNGSAANPWKERGDIDWTMISAVLATNPVTIYFSSRGTWNTLDQYITLPSNANTT